MTNVDDTTPLVGDASAVVAESLSTVGYAMFALLNTGPLEQIPSMQHVVERFRLEAEDAALAATGPVVPHPEPAYDGDPDGEAFGKSGVGENFDAVPNPNTPLPAPVPVAASSVQVPAGPPSAEDAAVEEETTEESAEAHPQPKDPVGSVPAYTGHHTLQMLQEISFLDE